MNTIGKRIKHIRQQSGETQKEFSKKINITQSMLSYIEQEKSDPADSVIKSLVLNYGVNPSWLTNGVGSPFDTVSSPDFTVNKLDNNKLLTDIISAVEEFVIVSNKTFTPTDKAKVIVSFYQYFFDNNISDITEIRAKVTHSIDILNSAIR